MLCNIFMPGELFSFSPVHPKNQFFFPYSNTCLEFRFICEVSNVCLFEELLRKLQLITIVPQSSSSRLEHSVKRPYT